jgi:phage shock protein PspC (stress-responsive transcriptional regulator)
MTTVNSEIRWKRSRRGWVAGVCAGLGEELGFEAWVLRLAFVALVLFGGFGLLIYLALAVSLPSEHRLEAACRAMLLGVCARLSRRTSIEIGLVRSFVAALVIYSLGAGLLLYIAAYFLIPDTPKPPARLPSDVSK